MRNSSLQHNPGPIVASLLLALPLLAAASEPLRIGREDTVAISADTAWEDLAPDTIHFSGHFEMRVRDWRLTADRATVHGPLEAPETVELEGSPARLDLVRHVAGRAEPIQAEALRIVYQRDPNRILLDGSARLAERDSVLHSSHIEYEPDTDRLHAEGKTGVRIDVRGTD
jgi:lipopolysaccharide transport protein LptA